MLPEMGLGALLRMHYARFLVTHWYLQIGRLTKILFFLSGITISRAGVCVKTLGTTDRLTQKDRKYSLKQ